MVSRDGSKQEDSTPDPQMTALFPQLDSEDKHLTNASVDEMVPGIIPPNTNNQKELAHTGTAQEKGNQN